MQPIKAPERVLAKYPNVEGVAMVAPEGVPEEECGTIYSLVGKQEGGIFDGGPVIRTFWTVDAEELEQLKNGGSIEICFYAYQLPPTAMFVHE